MFPHGHLPNSIIILKKFSSKIKFHEKGLQRRSVLKKTGLRLKACIKTIKRDEYTKVQYHKYQPNQSVVLEAGRKSMVYFAKLK